MNIFSHFLLPRLLLSLAFVQVSHQCSRKPTPTDNRQTRTEKIGKTFSAYTDVDLAGNLKLFANEKEFTVLENRLKEIQASQSDENLQNFINGLFVISTIPIPGVSVVSGFWASSLQFLEAITKVPTDNAEFWSFVSDVADRQIFIQMCVLLKAHLKNIEPILKTMNNSELSRQQKENSADIGINTLQLILNLFNDDSSVLRKYPFNSTPVLLSMADLIMLFTPLASSISPTFRPKSEAIEFLNKFVSLLEAYKELSIDYRMNLITTSTDDYVKRALKLSRPLVGSLNDGNCFKPKGNNCQKSDEKWPYRRERYISCHGSGRKSSCDSTWIGSEPMRCIHDKVNNALLVGDYEEEACYRDYQASLVLAYKDVVDPVVKRVRQVVVKLAEATRN